MREDSHMIEVRVFWDEKQASRLRSCSDPQNMSRKYYLQDFKEMLGGYFL